MKPQSTINFFKAPPVLLFGVAYLMALFLSVFICISIYSRYSESSSVVKESAVKNSETINTAAIINHH